MFQPLCLTYTGSVSELTLFLIPEGWQGFTEPSKPSLEHHWNIDNE